MILRFAAIFDIHLVAMVIDDLVICTVFEPLR